MNPLQPLIALLAQTERERDAAFAAAQRAQQAAQAAAAQAEQLLGYRRDYEQRWSARFRHEGSAELLHCYRGFVERLTQAVEQQQRIAEQAAARSDAARTTLAEHQMRVAAVRKLIERRRHETHLAAARAELKQSDELGARMAWHARSGLGVGLTGSV